MSELQLQSLGDAERRVAFLVLSTPLSPRRPAKASLCRARNPPSLPNEMHVTVAILPHWSQQKALSVVPPVACFPLSAWARAKSRRWSWSRCPSRSIYMPSVFSALYVAEPSTVQRCLSGYKTMLRILLWPKDSQRTLIHTVRLPFNSRRFGPRTQPRTGMCTNGAIAAVSTRLARWP